MTIQRYTWEDALIRADVNGKLSKGAVNLCLRLAMAINWEPGNARAGMPSGLYWDNESALKAVGSSRATYHRHRAELFAAGFFIEIKGNLIPQIPAESQTESVSSQTEIVKSQSETAQSQNEHPYSEDTYTDDSYSEKTYKRQEPVVADAPTVSSENLELPIRKSGGTSLNRESTRSSLNVKVLGSKSGKMLPKSHNETDQQRQLREETRKRTQEYMATLGG